MSPTEPYAALALMFGLPAILYLIGRSFGKQAGRESASREAYEQGLRDGYRAGEIYGPNPLNPPPSRSAMIPPGTPRPPVPHTRYGHTSIKTAPGPRDWEPGA